MIPAALCTGLRVVFLNHQPFATCSDWQEAERLAFDLRRFHHARRVAILQASHRDQILWQRHKETNVEIVAT